MGWITTRNTSRAHAPAPIKHTRKSKIDRTSNEAKAMAHQVISLAHDKDAPDGVVLDLSDAGTGKTFVRIKAFAGRRKKKGGCALILAPRTLLRTAWANDFKKFAPDMKVAVATADKREKAFAEDVDAYITNHDAVKWLAKRPKGFFAKFSELVIDEPTAFKHHTSQRSRALARIVKHFMRRAGMTATPNSNGICDIWHQVYVLDDGKRLGDSFYSFRNTVCTPKQVGKDKNAIEWRDKDGAEEAVFGLLADIVIRHKLDDCADIPQTHFHTIEYELPSGQRKTYDQLELAQFLVLVPDQVAAKLTGTPAKITLTAINAAAVATKLLQLCSGSVYDNAGNYHVIDEGRYDLVLDLIEARHHPLCFFQWKHQKDLLTQKAKARGLRHAVIDGESSDADRKRIVDAYQNGLYDVVFGHPRSVAHGLTLTKGTSTIWPGPIYDLELWEQGNRRQRRIGQTKKTEVVTVIAPGTIEEKVYEILAGKNKRMTTLLDLFSSLAAERVK